LRWIFICKRSLKTPKGKSESVYRRRTDNTTAKRKGQKDKQWPTKHTYKTKERLHWLYLKPCTVPFVICRFFLLCVFLIKHLDEITNGRFGRHWNRFNSMLPLHFCEKCLYHVRLSPLYGVNWQNPGFFATCQAHEKACRYS
jgi:hypothetical protein